MARLDTPTLECDRCKEKTSDLTEMISFAKIYHPNLDGKTEGWDLCPRCWTKFQFFIHGKL